MVVGTTVASIGGSRLEVGETVGNVRNVNVALGATPTIGVSSAGGDKGTGASSTGKATTKLSIAARTVNFAVKCMRVKTNVGSNEGREGPRAK